MERTLLISHAVSGGIVLILGLINFINRKGAKNHLLLGKIYVGTMWWICLSAFIIILFYRFSFFLMVIGVLTFYGSFVGVRVLKRKKPGSEKWYDWVVAVLTGLFGVALTLYGIKVFLQTGGFHVLGLLSLIFGLTTLKSGTDDIRFFLAGNKSNLKMWWLYQHIGAMGGSYIAAVTAFAVQNSEIFVTDASYQWLTWIIPPAIGSTVLSLISRKYRRKYEPTERVAVAD